MMVKTAFLSLFGELIKVKEAEKTIKKITYFTIANLVEYGSRESELSAGMDNNSLGYITPRSGKSCINPNKTMPIKGIWIIFVLINSSFLFQASKAQKSIIRPTNNERKPNDHVSTVPYAMLEKISVKQIIKNTAPLNLVGLVFEGALIHSEEFVISVLFSTFITLIF